MLCYYTCMYTCNQFHFNYDSKTLVFYIHFCFHGNLPPSNIPHTKIDCETISFEKDSILCSMSPKINPISADQTDLFHCSSALEDQMGLKNSLGLSRLQSQALEGILTRKISLLHVLFIKKLFAQVRLHEKDKQEGTLP